MCSGSGDYGATRAEEQRQQRQDAAISRINRLFGVDDGGLREPNRADFTTTRGGSVGGNREDVPGETVFDESAYQQAVQDWQRGQTEAQDNRTARDALYGQVRSDTVDRLTTNLDEQRDLARRRSNFDLVRRGAGGSSNVIDRSSDLLRDYTRAAGDVALRGDAAEAELKAADEQARLDLIARIRGGLSADSAAQSALSQLDTGARDARANAGAAALGQVFADYTNNYVARQAGGGYNPYAAPSTTYRGNPARFYGR